MLIPRTVSISTLALAAAFAANGALACPVQGKGWTDFSSFKLNISGQLTSTITLLTDGLHAKLESDGKQVEMMDIQGLPKLYFGHDFAKGRSPFMFFDMVMGAALTPIGQHYGAPCGVPDTPVPFTWTGSGGYASVLRGQVRWLDSTTLAYELLLDQRTPTSSTMTMSGEIRFSERQPAPADMPLTGWLVTGGGNAPFKPDILPPAATLRELRERTAKSR